MLERVTAAPLARRPAVPGPADPEGASGRPAEVRRRELAEFLRSRRERLRPDHVGLPVTGRRRTPGLRREEVAALAGVGVTWYTWLEQARNVTPSAQVLEAISRALQLDGPEQTHLFVLAGLGPSRPAEAAPAVDPGVAHLLRQLEPFPAVLSNARYDLLAYNSTYRHVISDLDLLPPQEPGMMDQVGSVARDVFFGTTGPRGGRHPGLLDSFVKSAARGAGSTLGREVTRGLFGSLFGRR